MIKNESVTVLSPAKSFRIIRFITALGYYNGLHAGLLGLFSLEVRTLLPNSCLFISLQFWIDSAGVLFLKHSMVPSTILKSLKAMPAEWPRPFKSFFSQLFLRRSIKNRSAHSIRALAKCEISCLSMLTQVFSSNWEETLYSFILSCIFKEQHFGQRAISNSLYKYSYITLGWLMSYDFTF